MNADTWREDIPVTTQGLLVKGTHGEDYLLTTEANRGMRTHRLVVLKKVNDQWKSVEGTEELVCREGLIGAFVDFFVDLCRVLNSSGHQQTSETASTQRSSIGCGQGVEPAVLPQGRT